MLQLVRYVRWVLLWAGVALLVYAVVMWNVHHFHLGLWLQIHTGTVNESGPYYGFFSGFGSDLGEIAIVGGVATIIAGAWHKVNCHNEGCWRIGIHHVAGGQYVVCRKHNNEITGHPHRKLSTEFLRRVHQEHLDRVTACPPGEGLSSSYADARWQEGPAVGGHDALRSADRQGHAVHPA